MKHSCSLGFVLSLAAIGVAAGCAGDGMDTPSTNTPAPQDSGEAVNPVSMPPIAPVSPSGPIAPVSPSGMDTAGNGDPPAPSGEPAMEGPASMPVGRQATATLVPLAGAPISTAGTPLDGTVTFEERTGGVNLTAMLHGCDFGKVYSFKILAATTCDAPGLAQPVWDAPRGEGITDTICNKTASFITSYYRREPTDAMPWTVGEPEASNLLGHVFVAYDVMQDGIAVACGPIVPAETSGMEPAAPPDGAGALSPAARARVAGYCVAKLAVHQGDPNCPYPEKIAACATEHCNLDSCLQACADHVACLDEQGGDVCQAACPSTPECDKCQSDVVLCMFGFCADAVVCEAATEGGACDELRECCQLQGERTPLCLDWVNRISALGGETSCIGLMSDWDFLTNVAFDPLCGTPPME